MHEIFELDKFLPPNSTENGEYHKSAWDTREINYKEEITHKEINEGLTAAMQE